MKKKGQGADKEVARSPLNREAGAYLERARKSIGAKPADFAVELGHQLGFEVGYNRYLSWENGDRTVPGPAIFAAFRLTGLPVADPEGERTLAERLLRLEEGLEELRSELHARRDTRPLGSAGPPRGGFRP